MDPEDNADDRPEAAPGDKEIVQRQDATPEDQRAGA